MPFLTITRLRLHSLRMLPRFLVINKPIMDQLVGSAGFITGKTRIEINGSAWTMTLWKDAESMRQFYLSGSHRDAMGLLSKFSREAATKSFGYECKTLPSWEEARGTLTIGANFNKSLKNPNSNQIKQIVPPLSLPLLWQKLKRSKRVRAIESQAEAVTE